MQFKFVERPLYFAAPMAGTRDQMMSRYLQRASAAELAAVLSHPPVWMQHLTGMNRILPAPGQESVWDYPRPPRLVASTRRVRVRFANEWIVDTQAAYRILETSHPPTWYVPPADVVQQFLIPGQRQTYCEWKGAARYWSVAVGDRKAVDAAWSYPKPSKGFEPIADYLAFYPNLVECWVDEERVEPQLGGFYGGWITSDIVGPFKGIPGSSGW